MSTDLQKMCLRVLEAGHYISFITWISLEEKLQKYGMKFIVAVSIQDNNPDVEYRRQTNTFVNSSNVL